MIGYSPVSGFSSGADAFWFRYNNLIYKLCWVKFKNKEKVQEFYQDIYIKFRNNADYVMTHNYPTRWFMTVVQNMFIDELRKNSNICYKKNLYCREKTAHYNTSFSLDNIISILLYSKHLSTLEQTIFNYTILEFSMEEISEITNTPVQSVRKILKKVYLKIKSLLAGHEIPLKDWQDLKNSKEIKNLIEIYLQNNL